MNPMSDATTSSKAKRRAVWLTLLVVLMIGLIVVMTPIWIIQPFKAQTVRDLQVSFAMRRVSPVLTIVASVTFLATGSLVVETHTMVWQGSVGCARDTTLRCNLDGATKSLRMDVSPACEHCLCATRRCKFCKRWRHGPRCEKQRRGRCLSSAPDGVSPSGSGRSWRDATRRYLLNALSHRSGVGNDSKRTSASLSPGGN